MIKKILLLTIAILFLSCGGGKPMASSRPSTKKPTSTASRTVKKPVVRKPVARNTSPKPQTSQSKSSNTTVYSKSEVLEATTRVKVTTDVVLDYIDQYKNIAKANMSQYGIPASIILGQGILESGAGTGPLSMIANNHFGIKCHKEWSGPSVKYDDDEAQECFRKYDQASQSYQDHSLFLTSRSRYAGLFELKKDDYSAWAKGLRAAGYATDPKYPQKLIGIIERYQLNKYDSEVLGTKYVATNVAPVITKEPMAVDGETYQVMQGDTLYSISRKFNLSVEELRRKNNLTENAISIGQNLKIK